jgi:hypothetical protein
VLGNGYNGGLSLRNPELFLRIAREEVFDARFPEDQWFFAKCVERGARLPERDVAGRFAMETIYYDEPLGYHQPQRWWGTRMDEIEEWCPEVKMLVGRRVE